MGLDMYLFARKRCYVSSWMDESNGTLKAELPKELDAFKDLDEVKNSLSVTFQADYKVGYWRKANHIHAWFVHNCADDKDECQEIYLELEDLEKLQSICAQVLQDHSKAEELLPTQSGFFFGGTEYDEFYFKDVEKTLEILNAAVKFLEERAKVDDYSWGMYYQASW